ncbi:MAG: WG repeat-containing protein [Bacteroidia bacterium]|jgi:hypothetical protein
MRTLFTFLFLSLAMAGFAQKKNMKPMLGYDKIYPYKESAAGRIAKVEKLGKMGFIKEDGEELVACKYDNIYPWEKGRAKVEIAGKYGFIREADGEEYIQVKYDYIGPFKNGLAIITNLGRRGLINEEGTEVVPLD